MKTLLVIDNYDSFTYNLVQMFSKHNLKIKVFRCDKLSLRQISIISPDYILISPGPKSPRFAGISIPVIQSFHKTVPIFGVCLGMQCINEAFGGVTKRAPVPVHGKTSLVTHSNHGIFEGMPEPFTAARYHSLIIEPENGQDHLQITATCDDNLIMGIEHTRYPLYGVQFHPESFLTEAGHLLVSNFLDKSILKLHQL